MRKIISIDIGGTNFRIGLVSENYECSYLEKYSSEFLKVNSAPKKLYECIQSYMIKNNINVADVEAVSIGVPSIVSKYRDFVYQSPNIAGLSDLNLSKAIEDLIKIPVLVDRDVNYLLKYDVYMNGLDENRNNTILGFYIGTGLGNAIYINGNIYRGKNGVAGELGHIPVINNNKICACGNIGCIETICSGKALREIKEKSFKDICIEDIFKKYNENREIKEFIEYLAIAISTEITLLDPDKIVISGGVVAMNDFPKEYLFSEIKKRSRHPYPSDNIEILFTAGKTETGVIGGAISYFDK